MPYWALLSRVLRPERSALGRVEDQLVGDVGGAIAGVGPSTLQLRNATGNILEFAAAAAIDDVACGMKAVAVPGTG